ncbi:PREDICTED: transmembrane epididymal protein 1A-like [Nanorana parkeri]|uniref:transmembrane epididymal protein 1A-like n=1 Tax=Nanorana parkeri TaxID=125878 RepID=UPI0008547605|nr:PREDICTED: transmembrane epididymal protein 1A-like [Nanorana parkeri]
MGTFIGHISPGLAFLSFGLLYAIRYSWMVLNGCKVQYAPRTKTKQKFWKTLPAEAVMKLVYSFMAVLAEFFFPPGVQKLRFFRSDDPEYHFQHPSEWQHATMYGTFFLSGILDIISQSCLQKRNPLLEHVGVTAAFFITTLLLKFHGHGKEAVEVQVHQLLLITCGINCAIMIFEIWHPNHRKLWFTKAWLVNIQGTWLFHAAFILYRPPTGHFWDSSDPANLMFLTTFYCWHLILNAGLVSLLFWLASILHKRWGSRPGRDDYQLAGDKAELAKLTEDDDEEL